MQHTSPELTRAGTRGQDEDWALEEGLATVGRFWPFWPSRVLALRLGRCLARRPPSAWPTGLSAGRGRCWQALPPPVARGAERAPAGYESAGWYGRLPPRLVRCPGRQ